MKSLLITVALIVLTGCTYNSAPDAISSKNITYFRDARTGVCFAATNSLDGHSGWKTTSITYVPCTDAVNKAIAGGQ
jgi:hypothetical protein